MISLFLDSSNRDLTVAIGNEQKIVDMISYEAWQRQSELMIPELEKLLTRNNLTRKDIGDVSVTIGPGSYTGVRIALTIAKVIAFSLNIPLYTFSSLMVMQNDKKPTICLINARSNRSYIGVFANDEVVLEDQVMSNDEVLKYHREHPSYELSGDLTYLGLLGIKVDLVMNMWRLKKDMAPINNVLEITPKYLKD